MIDVVCFQTVECVSNRCQLLIAQLGAVIYQDAVSCYFPSWQVLDFRSILGIIGFVLQVHRRDPVPKLVIVRPRFLGVDLDVVGPSRQPSADRLVRFACLPALLEDISVSALQEEVRVRILLTQSRIVVMYAVVGSVNLVARFERKGRMEAMERQQALLRDRIEFSQTIHDTTAQSAYTISLGIDTAIELAGKLNRDLNATLASTPPLSKATIWELRRPLDAGHIFEGRALGSVLRSHTSSFTTIASVLPRWCSRGPTHCSARRSGPGFSL